METTEFEVLKKMYNNVKARLGALGTMNIRMKTDKDGDVEVAYSVSGTGEKRMKKVKLSGKKPIEKEVKKPKATKPKSILKKKEKKGTKWDSDEKEEPESESEEELNDEDDIYSDEE